MSITDRQLQELFKQLGVKNLLVVSLGSSKKQGDRLLLPNGVSATCLRDIPKGQAIAILTDKGNWYLVGEDSEGRRQEAEGRRNLEYRRTKYRRKVEKANIKILFSKIELDGVNPKRSFYVGGDRPEPTFLFSIPAGTDKIKAYIDNYGGKRNDFAVSISYNFADNQTKAFNFINDVPTILIDKPAGDRAYPVNYLGSTTLYHTPSTPESQEISYTPGDPTSDFPACTPQPYIYQYQAVPEESFETNSIIKTLTIYSLYDNDPDGLQCLPTDDQQDFDVSYVNKSLLLQQDNLQSANVNIVEDYYSYITAEVIDLGSGNLRVESEERTAGNKATNIVFNNFNFTTSSTLTNGVDLANSAYSGTATIDIDKLICFYGKGASIKQDLSHQISFTTTADFEGIFFDFDNILTTQNDNKILLALPNSEIEINQESSIKISTDSSIDLLTANSIVVQVSSPSSLSFLVGKNYLCGRYLNPDSTIVAQATVSDVSIAGLGVYNVTFNIDAGESIPYASFTNKDTSKLHIISSNDSIQQILLRNSQAAENYLINEGLEYQYILNIDTPASYYKLPNHYNFTRDIAYSDDALEYLNLGAVLIDNMYRTNLIGDRFFISDMNLDIKNQDANIYTEEWAIAPDGKVNLIRLIKTKAYSLKSEDCTIHSVQYYA